MPPLEEQREIIALVEVLLSLVDAFEIKINGGCNSFEKLMPAILEKAFRGELVPQDPEDEPAGELIARLQNKGSIKKTESATPERVLK